MSDPIWSRERATFGVERPTVLFVAWLFVGCSFVGLATVTAGGVEPWLFLLGGLSVVAHVGREWFLRAGGDFATHRDDPLYLAVTVGVLAVTLWLLLSRIGL
jgi:hypothetical protein